MLDAFQVLREEDDAPGYPLPADVARIYGRLGFNPGTLYANFVASIDGVVALGPTLSAGSVISGRYPADRFLMGLLRACADAVVIGAGTLRGTPGHQWTPGHVAPDHAADFAALRQSLRLATEPRLVVLSASGEIDAEHVAIKRGATIITTAEKSGALSGQLPSTCEVIGVGHGQAVDMRAGIEKLRSHGYATLLTEGGPHIMGSLLKEQLLDELFLTVSPVVAGRDREPRLGMVAGAELLPGSAAWGHLASLRSHGDYLFLRYRLRAG